MSKKISLLCVDLQNDFSSEGGSFYEFRPSVQFLIDTFFPFLQEKGIKVSEIISDYRQPRPGDDRDCCRPGEWGYESIIPDIVRNGRQWIKCMNSPVWTREGIGDPDSKPGEPFPDPDGFRVWMEEHIGTREEIDSVVVFGLTADCCVLAAVQEFRWRGFDVRVLVEGTDLRHGGRIEKKQFLTSPPFTFWGSSINYNELLKLI